MQISIIKKLKIQSLIRVIYGPCLFVNKKADLSKVILEACCVLAAISGELKSAKQ
ncbi:hypothetical protein [Bacillus mycoides]|uniref:hypothetical protein n=1 Tax=Bacillus mycoides TaxID=1405 RepID=UPI000A3F1E52|nr:hypothetical protein [Bacillus mycoides]